MQIKNSDRLSEQLREKLEEGIATGTFHPGTRLDEVELATLYGVSRTPIREALIALAAAGLIDKRARKGWEVTEMSPTRLCEMFDVMAELESMCARLAARRASDEDQRRIRKAHEDCLVAKEAGDAAEYFRLNEVFHMTIFEASHNSFLFDHTCALHKRLRPYRRLQLRVRNRMANSFREHGEIVEAILAGDEARAAESLRRHVGVIGERFTDLVALLAELSASGRQSASF